jgi:hypothetical protein
MAGTVAVIGLGKLERYFQVYLANPYMKGPLGIVAIKNLLEEGFEVTGFERNSYVGGLWQYTEDGKTSVLKYLFKLSMKCRGRALTALKQPFPTYLKKRY